MSMDRAAAGSAGPFGTGPTVTVGTCDGIHLGHSSVLGFVADRARENGSRSILVTFEPHPLSVVRPQSAPGLLTTGREKREALAATGIDIVVFLAFTRSLSLYSPRRFIEEILVGKLGARTVVVGYDHGFGRDRSGDAATLRRAGREFGFEVALVPPLSVGGSPVSSSRVRRAVAAGLLEEAAELLGRPYSISGRVVRGDGRGRSLGFPTANLRVAPEKLLPPPGVYAVRAWLRAGSFAGALHLGPRPTFTESAPSVEVHLIDYPGSTFYGEIVSVDLLEMLRPVKTFSNTRSLAEAIRADVGRARKIWARSAS